MDVGESGKVLVAVDGSVQSLAAAKYAAATAFRNGVQLVLMHILTRVPESYYDLARFPDLREKVAVLKDWDKQNEQATREFMEKCQAACVAQGPSKSDVVVAVKELERGIARDLLDESRNDYAAVVLGRVGRSKVKDLVMGSVANKLIGRLGHIPVWVIGGNPNPGRLLIALDGSEDSLKTVRYAASTLDMRKQEVCLFHVSRAVESPDLHGGPLDAELDRYIQGLYREQTDRVMIMAKDILIQAGGDARQVRTKTVSGKPSRADTIVREAEEGNYDTIVLGRKGVSKVEEFLIGRVSSKVLHKARTQAVWVVD
jgi:nucleotide-binding universal stress UspA family protein